MSSNVIPAPRMRRSTSRLRLFAAIMGVLSLIGVNLFMQTNSAQAHTPSVSATCETLSVNLTQYASHTNKVNKVVVTVDGKQVASESFGATFKANYTFDDRYVAHSYRVQVTAWDSSTWNLDTSGQSKPCGYTPNKAGYDLQCAAITVDYGRALTNGDHINMTVRDGDGAATQRNAYVDLNVAGGYQGLGVRINGYGSFPLTQQQVQTGRIIFAYGPTMTSSYYTVEWVQMNATYFNQSRDSKLFFNCGTPPVKPKLAVIEPIAEPSAPTCSAPGSLPELRNGEGYTLAWDRPYDGPGSYIATATIADGYVVADGAATVFTVVVPPAPRNCPPPVIPITVQPAVPTASDVCGTEQDALNIPEDTDQVAYTVDDQRTNGVGSVVVTATAKPGFEFDAKLTTSWTFQFTDEACPPVIIPITVQPAVPTASDVCGTEQDALNIPEDTDQVAYTVDDQRTNGVGSVVVTATAKPGFEFDAKLTTSWTFQFTDEACPPTVVVITDEVTPPTFDDLCGTDKDAVNIPANGKHFTYVVTDSLVNGVREVTVRVVANEGYAFSPNQVTSWRHVYGATPCESTKPPVDKPEPTAPKAKVLPPSPVAQNKTLAQTGADSTLLFAGGGALLLLGGGVLLALRLRRRVS